MMNGSWVHRLPSNRRFEAEHVIERESVETEHTPDSGFAVIFSPLPKIRLVTPERRGFAFLQR